MEKKRTKIFFVLFSFVHSHIKICSLFLFLLDVVIVVYFLFLCAGCVYFLFAIALASHKSFIHSFFDKNIEINQNKQIGRTKLHFRFFSNTGECQKLISYLSELENSSNVAVHSSMIIIELRIIDVDE